MARAVLRPMLMSRMDRTAQQNRLAHRGRVLTWLAAIVGGLVATPMMLYGCIALGFASAGFDPDGPGLGCGTQACVDTARQGAVVGLSFAALWILWLILSAWSTRSSLVTAIALGVGESALLMHLGRVLRAGGAGPDLLLLVLAVVAALMALASGVSLRAMSPSAERGERA